MAKAPPPATDQLRERYFYVRDDVDGEHWISLLDRVGIWFVSRSLPNTHSTSLNQIRIPSTSRDLFPNEYNTITSISCELELRTPA